MQSFRYSRCRGAIIVFVLMGLIALLCLAVVFLSRAGRGELSDDKPGITNSPASSTTGISALHDTSTTGSPTLESQDETPEVIPPPPPPPIPTVIPANQPPEG